MYKRSMVGLLLAASALSTFAHAGNTPIYRNDDPAVITDLDRADGDPGFRRPDAARAYAMMHIAMFDAVNSIEGGYTPYRVRVPAYRMASGEAAAAQAAHDVLVALLPAGTAGFDAALATRLATIQPVRAQLGAQVGSEVAKNPRVARERWLGHAPDFHAARAAWRVATTPPAFAQRPSCRPVMRRPFGCPLLITSCRAARRRSTARNTRTRSMRSTSHWCATSTVRTAEQTLQARLWASVGYKENWAGIWNQVTRFMTLRNNLDADRVRAPVRAGQRQHAGWRADSAGQQVRVPALAPGDRHPARRRRHESGDRCGSDLDAVANYPAVPSYAGNMACIGASSARARPCTSAPTTSWCPRNGPAPMASTTWSCSPASGSCGAPG